MVIALMLFLPGFFKFNFNFFFCNFQNYYLFSFIHSSFIIHFAFCLPNLFFFSFPSVGFLVLIQGMNSASCLKSAGAFLIGFLMIAFGLFVTSLSLTFFIDSFDS